MKASFLSSVDFQKVLLGSGLYPQNTMVPTQLSLCVFFVPRTHRNRFFIISSSSTHTIGLNRYQLKYFNNFVFIHSFKWRHSDLSPSWEVNFTKRLIKSTWGYFPTSRLIKSTWGYLPKVFPYVNQRSFRKINLDQKRRPRVDNDQYPRPKVDYDQYWST